MAQVQWRWRQQQVDVSNQDLSLRKQCELLKVNRSTVYYKKKPVSVEDTDLLNEIRDIWLRLPFYGYRRITKELQANGFAVNRKRVQRLMKAAGIAALYPGPNTSKRNKEHKIYPYLLKDLVINKPNQAWMVDITYLRMRGGFMYLVALIDVYSRYVVGWSLSNTLETPFCVEALNQGLRAAKPGIVNSDQGSQFTSDAWIDSLNDNKIGISMTGKGRCLDNVYIERFWRSFKQEEFYLNDYDSVTTLKKAINKYIEFYNHKRWHQSLDYKTPADVYFAGNKEKSTIMVPEFMIAKAVEAKTQLAVDQC